MSKGRNGEEFGYTARRVISDWVDLINGVSVELDTKYTSKGNQVEDEAIEMVKDFLGLNPFLLKNTDRFENDWFTGTPDLIVDDLNLIIDVKSSWEYWTFPYMMKDLPEKKYNYQGQGYMDLTGIKDYIVAYVLCNTPEELVDDGVYLDYSCVPLKQRVKLFKVKHDPKSIDLAKSRVEQAREFINDNYVDVS